MSFWKSAMDAAKIAVRAPTVATSAIAAGACEKRTPLRATM